MDLTSAHDPQINIYGDSVLNDDTKLDGLNYSALGDVDFTSYVESTVGKDIN